MIVNHYKVRSHIKRYNLGEECSARPISVDLAKGLLKANLNSCALLLSTENITLYWYLEMPLSNYIFRMGGAVVLLSNKPSDRAHFEYQLLHTVQTLKEADDRSYNCIYQKEDVTEKVGVCLARELMAVVGDILHLFL
ncbi:hypothetical protein Fmac_020480 [Flemingia macrophylla]|uniref:FAE domain-containing protein n=1 Tax=Flemingia macrophylla TaxID=520843 RepID=A0ABD1LU75_9FABA